MHTDYIPRWSSTTSTDNLSVIQEISVSMDPKKLSSLLTNRLWRALGETKGTQYAEGVFPKPHKT